MRKTWKEFALGILNLLILIAIATCAQLRFGKYLHGMGDVVMAVIFVAAYLAAVKWIEQRSPDELALKPMLTETSAGLLIGFTLFCAVMAILWLSGVYHPAGTGTYRQLASGFAFALLAGINEEILFRGLLFRLCSKIVGTWGALFLTAILFGVAHATNRGATVGSSLAIALEAGVLLGAAYASTKRLWLPIGMHIAWNFTESTIFGVATSGVMGFASVIRGTLTGPRILTGGEFGPEASIVAVVICLAAALYFICRMVKRRLVEPPVWRKN